MKRLMGWNPRWYNVTKQATRVTHTRWRLSALAALLPVALLSVDAIHPAQASTQATYIITAASAPTYYLANHPLLSCDDCTQTVQPPFPLQFYGKSYNSAVVSSNALIQFGSTGSASPNNDCLPSSQFSTPTLAVHWDDFLYPDDTYGVYTGVFGKVGVRKYVVRWVPEYVEGDDDVDFEAVFAENSPTIRIIHNSDPCCFHDFDTIGTQAEAGTSSSQFSCPQDEEFVPPQLIFNYVPGSGAPVVSGINNRFISPSSITSDGLVPVETTWEATDANDTIASFQAQVQINGGAWSEVSLATPTSQSLVMNLGPQTYIFRVRGADSHGNLGEWATGTPFFLNTLQESSLVYHGAWIRDALAGAWEGSVAYTRARNASASITFTGRNIAWVGTKGPTYGSAKVYIDNGLVKTVDCHASSSAKRQILFRWSSGQLTDSTHTLKIVALGTSGHPRIDVDGLIWFDSQ